jgi:hypothetical protein
VVEVDRIPAEGADLGWPEPTPKGDQDHDRVANAVAILGGRLPQPLDLGFGQVFARAQLGGMATVRKTVLGLTSARCDLLI